MMASPRKSSVTGFKEAKQVLDRLPQQVQRRVLQRAVNAGVRVLARAVKAAAPRGEKQSPNSEKYGSIFKNIQVQTLKRVARTARGARVWTRDAFWAYFYEFGSRHQPARPFFRPAVDGTADEAFMAMRDQLGAGIEQEATKLAASLGIKN